MKKEKILNKGFTLLQVILLVVGISIIYLLVLKMNNIKTLFTSITTQKNQVISMTAGYPTTLHLYGLDGSKCEETIPGDYSHQSYCTDSTGFDSRKEGLNTCTSYAGSKEDFAPTYNCYTYYLQTTWGVRCNARPTLNNCKEVGKACVNGVCTVNKKTTRPPQISLIYPSENTQVAYGQRLRIVVSIDRVYDDLQFVTVYVNGIDIDGSCHYNTGQTKFECNWQTLLQARAVPNLQPLVQVFAKDASGNIGYTQLHLRYK